MIKIFFCSKDVDKLKTVGNEELAKDLKKQLTLFKKTNYMITASPKKQNVRITISSVKVAD